MRLALSAAALVVIACRSGPIPDSVFRCEADGRCRTEGLVCASDGWCRAPGEEVGEDPCPGGTCGVVGLSPLQLSTPCEGWWQWRTGLTVDDTGGVAEWQDQCPHGRHFTQPVSTRRPFYDADAGVLTPDGVDDFLRNESPPNAVEAEVTLVVEQPRLAAGVVLSLENSPTVDADALCFSVTANGSVVRYIIVAASRLMQTADPLLSVGEVAVVSITNEQVFINGREATYVERVFHGYSSASRRRMELFGRVRNNGNDTAGSPSAPSNVPVREVMWHSRTLSPEDRAAMVAHVRWRQGW